ncbi:MAG TPA: ABC transporter ATP-binding protein [Thermodesulfobacteriota bacterium]|nr:ABC transporter ATP-binding protein [Thermodesulfobacteriota bacterium]
MLSVKEIAASYGHVQVLSNVSLEIAEKRTVTLIGSNGAGKSTLLKVISGLLKPRRGTVEFQGERIDGLPPDRIVAKGIAHCPEGRRLFPELSVFENLEMGAYLSKSKKFVQGRIDQLFESFPILRERRGQLAGTLSGGEQQQLAIARALALNPKMVLFDEPSLGLAPILVDQVERILLKLREEKITILLVEQNAGMALDIANYAYVMETGAIILEGPCSELRKDEKVVKAYLGGLE